MLVTEWGHRQTTVILVNGVCPKAGYTIYFPACIFCGIFNKAVTAENILLKIKLLHD
jgi:hypothetical protein